ncbi:outer membrane putative beta-barrel porin/alpha-amylase [Roseimicrobium gellanilyticum]|uniref:Outer membrane putative beta-barrel porin/alpha-amylase n=1 Tax=Roseimicrobium gellanilyticum TaxID=748857 RepID=A0A366HMC2_9BACT|nr:transporter [Roseimicrobium gellanilyticum]RBP43727.1 outer membrane putative beta-barrel porin/alpha-amylase [Roseimicrobium gellanilyticum]
MRVSILFLSLFPVVCQALEPASPPDKSSYTLLNPTPREFMREMSTDRPDTTESAYSVDAGHFQVESTLFGFAKDGGVEGFTFAESNFKLGLTNNTDLQLVVPFYEHVRGDGVDEGGIGDLQVRWKWNLLGNDQGDIALAVMPFIKAPTASHDLGNDKVEGGVILPLAVTLNDTFSFGTMFEVDWVYDDVRDGYEVDFVNTIVLGIELSERWGSFVEFISVATTRAEASWEGYAKAGVTFAVSDDFVLDAGAAVGVNDAAEDFGAFVGFSWRH